MSKLSLDKLTSSFSFQAAYNDVLTRIEEEFSDKVLYRNNPEGEPNNMYNDLDMSTHDILNVGVISASGFNINGQDLTSTFKEVVEQIEQAVTDAEAAATESTASALDSKYWADIAASSDLETRLALPAGASLVGYGGDTVEAALGNMVNVNELSADSGASLVGFSQDGVSSETRTVESKLRESVSVKDFGAIGDGVADDTSSIQAAINSLSPGQTLDGLGRTYRCDSGLVLKANMTLKNIAFDFQNAGNSIEGLVASGSMSPSSVISGTVSAGVNSVVVASANGLTAGSYVYLGSSNMWDDWDDLVTFGEVHRIKSIEGTTITFHDRVLYTMTSCSLAKINTLDNLILRDVRAYGSFVGATGDQEGGRFTYCRNLVLDNCEFKGFDDRAIRLSRCIDFSFQGGSYGEAQKTGLSYGLALGNCCTRGIIKGASFNRTRHGVTLGDNDGPNRFIVIDSCIASECDDAGFDAHTAADHCTVSNCIVYCDPQNTNSHGILWRSANVNITGNRIVSPGGNGIFIRDNMTGINTGDLNVQGNTIIGCNGAYGILYQKSHKGNRLLLNISNNTAVGNGIANSCGIAILSDSVEASHRIQGATVSNNILREFLGSLIIVHARNSTAIITEIVISNNALRGNAARGIYLLAVTAGYINNIVIVGNVLAGTMTTGVLGTNDQNTVITSNYLRSATTKTSISATNFVNANNLI